MYAAPTHKLSVRRNGTVRALYSPCGKRIQCCEKEQIIINFNECKLERSRYTIIITKLRFSVNGSVYNYIRTINDVRYLLLKYAICIRVLYINVKTVCGVIANKLYNTYIDYR